MFCVGTANFLLNISDRNVMSHVTIPGLFVRDELDPQFPTFIIVETIILLKQVKLLSASASNG